MTYLKLSVSMALEALREQCNVAVEQKQEYEKQLAIRNDLVKDARAPGINISRKNLASVTGLSVQYIMKIEEKPYSEYYDGPHYSAS